MTNVRVAVVGIEGAWSTDALADALERATGYRLVVDLADVTADLDSGAVYFRDVRLDQLDGIVVKKLDRAYSPDMYSRLEVLRYLQSRGVRVFSRPENIAGMLNRLSCTARLREHDIPMPPTVVTEDPGLARAAIEGFGRAVLKPLYSTKARGMEVVEADAPDLAAAIEAFGRAGNRCFYIQKMLPLGDRDHGIVFMGGRHVGSYSRVRADGQWNTTTNLGGHYECYEAPDEVVDLAARAQAPFGLDYTSVDVAEVEGRYVVFEVSAFGGFRGLRDGCGLDVATQYAEYVAHELRAGAQ